MSVTSKIHRLVEECSSELFCSLCGSLFKAPYTFQACNHTFCWECVVKTLEGPGIVRSQCPQCGIPAWKRELRKNWLYDKTVNAIRAAQSILKDLECLQPALPRDLGLANSSCISGEGSVMGNLDRQGVWKHPVCDMTPTAHVCAPQDDHSLKSLVETQATSDNTPSVDLATHTMDDNKPSVDLATRTMDDNKPSVDLATRTMDDNTPSVDLATRTMDDNKPSVDLATRTVDAFYKQIGCDEGFSKQQHHTHLCKSHHYPQQSGTPITRQGRILPSMLKESYAQFQAMLADYAKTIVQQQLPSQGAPPDEHSISCPPPDGITLLDLESCISIPDVEEVIVLKHELSILESWLKLALDQKCEVEKHLIPSFSGLHAMADLDQTIMKGEVEIQMDEEVDDGRMIMSVVDEAVADDKIIVSFVGEDTVREGELYSGTNQTIADHLRPSVILSHLGTELLDSGQAHPSMHEDRSTSEASVCERAPRETRGEADVQTNVEVCEGGCVVREGCVQRRVSILLHGTGQLDVPNQQNGSLVHHNISDPCGVLIHQIGNVQQGRKIFLQNDGNRQEDFCQQNSYEQHGDALFSARPSALPPSTGHVGKTHTKDSTTYDKDTPKFLQAVEDKQSEALPLFSNPGKVIVFTNVDKLLKRRWMKLIELLGESEVQADVDKETTHVISSIVDHNDKLITRRSKAYLLGILSGAWVLHLGWLEECERQGKWVEEEPYLIQGDSTALGAPAQCRLKATGLHNLHTSILMRHLPLHIDLASGTGQGLPAGRRLFSGRTFCLDSLGLEDALRAEKPVTQLLTMGGGAILMGKKQDASISHPSDTADDSKAETDPERGDVANRLDQESKCSMAASKAQGHFMLLTSAELTDSNVQHLIRKWGVYPLSFSWVFDSVSHMVPLPEDSYRILAAGLDSKCLPLV